MGAYFPVCTICFKDSSCDDDNSMGEWVLIFQYVPFVLRIQAVTMIIQWGNGCLFSSMYHLLLARLESAYSLIWGSHEI